jgi:hypothetical protein
MHLIGRIRSELLAIVSVARLSILLLLPAHGLFELAQREE